MKKDSLNEWAGFHAWRDLALSVVDDVLNAIFCMSFGLPRVDLCFLCCTGGFYAAIEGRVADGLFGLPGHCVGFPGSFVRRTHGHSS
jgi:hypothetical protein